MGLQLRSEQVEQRVEDLMILLDQQKQATLNYQGEVELGRTQSRALAHRMQVCFYSIITYVCILVMSMIKIFNFSNA